VVISYWLLAFIKPLRPPRENIFYFFIVSGALKPNLPKCKITLVGKFIIKSNVIKNNYIITQYG
jgi:hypothetical protein